MANTTVIITQSGNPINSQEDWRYSINVERYRYKNHEDRFNVEISASKRILTDSSFDTKNEITILRYNRAPNIPTLNLRLNEAHETLQHLLEAIANGENSWDAREHK